MDENFENIILDEDDDLDFKVESLREKSHRDNNSNQKNLNKDVMNLLSNEENHLKPITGNKKIKNYKEEEEKELSEEYNDFEYNIDEKIDREDKSLEKQKNNNFQTTPLIIDENDHLYKSSSNSNDKIENINLSSERDKIKNNNNLYDNNNLILEKDNNNVDNEEYNNIEENDNIINDNNNYQSLKEESDKEKINEKNENDIEIDKEKEIIKNSSSMMQLIEDNYYLTKNELETILSKLEFNNVKEITYQNKQLIDYISKLNSIMSAINKIFPKGEKLLSEKISKYKKINREKETKEDKEKKIVGIYRREYLRLENKYQLIKDPAYKESLLFQLDKLQKEYEQLYQENSILREEQRKNEISIERKTRNSTKEKTEVKRIEMDIDNIRSQINLIQKKVDRNKITIIENNKKINQYVEREKNLDYIAKEKYGIKEYQDIRLNQENKMKMMESKNNLIRKIEIYEKGIETNKNKYEREIRENETIINDLENEKLNLIYHYKELIGDEEFQKIIQNFKKEYNYEKNKNIKDNKEIKEIKDLKDIKSEDTEECKKEQEKEKIDISINESKDENLLTLKENKNHINEIKNTNKQKYPEFLDFFEGEENDDIKEISTNSEKNDEIKEEENKEEKEIKIAKFEEINSLRNKEKEEEESPPNEYEDLEEFQI